MKAWNNLKDLFRISKCCYLWKWHDLLITFQTKRFVSLSCALFAPSLLINKNNGFN